MWAREIAWGPGWGNDRCSLSTGSKNEYNGLKSMKYPWQTIDSLMCCRLRTWSRVFNTVKFFLVFRPAETGVMTRQILNIYYYWRINPIFIIKPVTDICDKVKGDHWAYTHQESLVTRMNKMLSLVWTMLNSHCGLAVSNHKIINISVKYP